MANRKGIPAGEAFISLGANNSDFERGLKSAQTKLKRFGDTLTSIGGRMAAFGGSATAGVGAALKVFADFETQMANVATMLAKPEETLAGLSMGVRDLSVKFGETTEALAGGLYDILSASVDASKALDVLEVSTKAAKAGLTDTRTAADAITTVLNAYGLSAEKAGDVSDLLFSIVQRGKTTFGVLAPNIGKVATLASSAGVSLEELGASLATMTRNGIQTEEAITALAAIISSFLAPSKEASDYARTLGFEMGATTLKADGLRGVFEKISGLPPDAISKLFPNVRALKGVLPALQNMAGFTEDLGVMANRAGATDTAFEKLANTLTTTFNKMIEQGKKLLSVIGEQLAPTFKKLSDQIMGAADAAIVFVKNNQGIVETVTIGSAVILGLGSAFLALGVAIKAAAFSIGAFGVATKAVTGTLAALSGAASPAIWFTAIAAAVAAAGYQIGKLYGQITGYNWMAGKLGEWVSSDSELDAQIEKLQDKTKDYQKSLEELAAAAGMTAEELKKNFEILEQSGKFKVDQKGGISLAFRNAPEEFARFLSIQEQIIKKYGVLTDETVRWYTMTVERGSKSQEELRKQAEKTIEVLKKINEVSAGVGETATPKILQGEFESKIKEIEKSLTLGEAQTDLEKLNNEMDNLRRGADAWRVSQLGVVAAMKDIDRVAAMKGIEKKYSEVIKTLEQYEKIQREIIKDQERQTALEEQKRLQDEAAQRVKQILDETKELHRNEIRNNGTLKERLALIEEETLELKAQAAAANDKVAYMAAEQLGNERKILETQKAQRAVAEQINKANQDAYADAVGRTKTIKDDLELLKQQEDAAIARAKAEGATDKDVAGIKANFEARRLGLKNNGPDFQSQIIGSMRSLFGQGGRVTREDEIAIQQRDLLKGILKNTDPTNQGRAVFA